MIHNVDSYSQNVTSHEHNLRNCVHKHSGGFLDADMDIKSSSQSAQTQQNQSLSLTDWLSMNVKKTLGNGIGFLRGIWSDAGESGENSESNGVTKGRQVQSGQQTAAVSSPINLPAMESVADVKPPLQKKEDARQESWKLAGAVPALKIKTGLARERFEAKKDAFLKKMKEMAKSRKNRSFKETKEDRAGQQEKETEWFEMKNAHLLDSYNKNGEYTNLGNRVEGQGYSGSLMKENYSKKV